MKPYKVIGKCIYSLSQPVPEALTDEHIMPFGISGKRQLKKASCGICQNITSLFERKVLKDDLKGLRTYLKFPTRHKKDIPKTLPMEIVTNDGETKEIEVP